MDTVLVTGGCGLIGQHICSGLLKKGFAVIAVDKEPGIYNEGKLHYSFIQAAPDDKNAFAEIFDNNKIETCKYSDHQNSNDRHTDHDGFQIEFSLFLIFRILIHVVHFVLSPLHCHSFTQTGCSSVWQDPP
ncbi:MAG: NAD-dependent epimerase/dehydratase family protein [Ruminococcus sp.]|nr:NAD-dependent epimerase/dehydratase family protein [Ruminococcus sp.]